MIPSPDEHGSSQDPFRRRGLLGASCTSCSCSIQNEPTVGAIIYIYIYLFNYFFFGGGGGEFLTPSFGIPDPFGFGKGRGDWSVKIGGPGFQLGEANLKPEIRGPSKHSKSP